jgi:riboflavin biosynthesis pyrimidine reductase
MGGGDISGSNPYDQAMMGLLRAVADVVVIGAETFRIEDPHFLTPGGIAPAFAQEYQTLRKLLGKVGELPNVIVSASGNVNLESPRFQQNKQSVLIITTPQGFSTLSQQTRPPFVHIVAAQEESSISAASILAIVTEVYQASFVLVEGGPRLMNTFIAERLLHELFLTLSPQIAGRDQTIERPGLVKGQLFAPDQPRWGKLLSLKRGGSHLFLRYGFETTDQ